MNKSWQRLTGFFLALATLLIIVQLQPAFGFRLNSKFELYIARYNLAEVLKTPFSLVQQGLQAN
jgi:hypothetical protein